MGIVIVNPKNLAKKYRPKYGPEVTKEQVRRVWIAGWMKSARKHRTKYSKLGVTKIKFVFGNQKQFRKI